MLSVNSTDLEHAYLTDHGLRVDLAHVVTGVVPLHVGDVQLPGVVSVVTNRHPIHFDIHLPYPKVINLYICNFFHLWFHC